jgi:diguanylate cyclase (GGDEF)-like protein
LDRTPSARLQAADLGDRLARPLAPGDDGAMIRRLNACATVALAPFAVLHFARGEATAAWLHVAVIAGLGVAASASRRHARTAAWIGTACAVGGCMALVALDAAMGMRWAYAAVVAAFLLLRPREAALASAALIAAIVVAGEAHASLPARVGFLVTASLVALGMHAFALRVARHDAEMDALATRDRLTGAGNARALQDELQLALEAARRERRPYGVAMLEVDHLAALSERHGEEVASQVLVDLARVLAEATRRTDRLFRTGPGTFVLLLPGADTAALGPMLDSLRLRIGDALRVDGEIIGVSIGAAALRAGDDATEAWLARAAAALDGARRAGRNRVEVCDCTVTADGMPMRLH